jgi:hypothetical protein
LANSKGSYYVYKEHWGTLDSLAQHNKAYKKNKKNKKEEVVTAKTAKKATEKKKVTATVTPKIKVKATVIPKKREVVRKKKLSGTESDTNDMD